MIIKLLDIEEIKEVDLTDNNLPIFLNKRYLRTINDTKIIGVFNSSILIAVLPIQIKKRKFFVTGQFLYEPFILSDFYDYKTILETIMVFLIDQNIVDLLIQTPSYIPFKNIPNNSISCDFGTYVLDLSKSETELFNNLHPKHRNVIRKSMKSKVIIDVNNADKLNACCELIAKTLKRSGKISPSYDYFKKIQSGIPENFYFSIAELDNKIQGCLILFYSSYSAYYMYGGSIQRPFTGAVNFLHWKAITDMKNRGVGFYNFVGARVTPEKGTKIEGIQRFKKRFGGTFIKGKMWKYPVNKNKYLIYDWLKSIKFFANSSYKGDIIDQETNRFR